MAYRTCSLVAQCSLQDGGTLWWVSTATTRWPSPTSVQMTRNGLDPSVISLGQESIISCLIEDAISWTLCMSSMLNFKANLIWDRRMREILENFWPESLLLGIFTSISSHRLLHLNGSEKLKRTQPVRKVQDKEVHSSQEEEDETNTKVLTAINSAPCRSWVAGSCNAKPITIDERPPTATSDFTKAPRLKLELSRTKIVAAR